MTASPPGPASAPTTLPYPPGTVLAGKYRVERLLGEGGMGWVVVAVHLQLEQRVAIKFLRAQEALDGSESVARFLREARAAARIQSEHVARVSDFGTLENGAPYLVMEYLEGHDLESLLRARGALPYEMAIEYALQACEGLAEAHAAGIVHRDLKPANLFLARRSDGSVRVKLLDFGISKLAAPGAAPETAMTSTQALMGSPLYMAPEQMRSSKNVDARADIWSMGVIVYEMLAGRPPFDGDTLPAVCARIMTEAPKPLRSFRQGLPAALESVVARCLEKDPQKRYPHVAALAEALAPFGDHVARSTAERIRRMSRAQAPGGQDTSLRDGLPAGPGRTVQTSATFSSTGEPPPTRRRARLPWALGAGVGLLVAAGLVTVATRRNEPAAPPAPSQAVQAPLAPEPPPAPSSPHSPSVSPALAAAPTRAPEPTPAAPVDSAQPPAPAPIALKPRTAAAVATPAKPAPHAKAPASPPRPAATAGFGGRD